jgi:TonB family protein
VRIVAPILALLIALTGCASGRASVALVNAQKSVTQAAQRGADEHATFEFTMAQAYLTKAREEASFSDYRTSVELSHQAAEWSDKAVITMATQGRGDTVPDATTIEPLAQGDETDSVADTTPDSVADTTPDLVLPTVDTATTSPPEPVKEPAILVAYRDAIKNQVVGKWKIPDMVAAAPPAKPTVLSVVITPTGAVESARISARSGVSELDISLLQALNAAAPYPPPPGSLRDDAGKLQVEGLTFSVNPSTPTPTVQPKKLIIIEQEGGQ